MISHNVGRKRLLAMPALSSVPMSWRARPVITGDVRPQVCASAGFVAATANGTDATPPSGLLAWSPPI